MGTTVPFSYYIESIPDAMIEHPSWRYGQTLFNILNRLRPDLADKIRSDSNLDPFYLDDRIPVFLAFVSDEWDTP